MLYDDLNEKQIQILKFIKNRVSEMGYPPSFREILTATGIKSTSTVHNHLGILESKGYIKKSPSKNRAIEVIGNDSNNISNSSTRENTKKVIDIPVLGMVTAGQPILATESIEDTFPIPADFLPRGEIFMLHVEGSSMIEAGILNGDMVMVRQQNNAENGDIVVALIDDSATVKRFYKKENHFILKPENSTMNPIVLDKVIILGKVVGLYRSY